jgi:PAS domain S-box-containing protein
MVRKPHSKVSRGKFWQRIHGQLLLVLFVLLVPILLIQLYVFDEWYKTRRESELQADLQIARAVAKTFDRFVEDVLHKEYAIGLALTESKIEDHRRYIDENRAEYPMFLNLLWINPRGVILVSHFPELEGQSISDRRYFQDITGGRDWAVSDLMLGKATGEPIIAIARAIRDKQEHLLGIVVATIIPDHLQEVLGFHRPEGGGHALVDSKGMLVYRYPSIDIAWERRNWLGDYPEFGEALNGKETSKRVFAPYEGKNRLVAFVPILSIGWAASAGRTEAMAMEPVVSQLLPQAVLFLLITVAAFGAAFLCSRFIADAVSGLRKQAIALGSGDMPNPVIVSGPVELKGLADSFNEMAERLRAREMSLREEREWLRVTLASIGDAVLATDAEGRISFLNPVAVTLTGWQIEEAMGRPVQDVFWIDDERTHEPADDIVGRVLREGCTVSLANHTVLVTRDGKQVPIEDSAAPIRDSSDKVIGVVLVFHDVTEKRRALEALRESEQTNRFLADIIQSGSQPFAVSYPDGRIGLVNAAFEHLTGYSSEELRSIDWANVLTPPEWQPVERLELDKLHRTGKPVRYEKEYIKKDGARVPIELLVHLVTDSDGKPLYYYAFLTDITERKEMLGKVESLARFPDENPNPILRISKDGRLLYANKSSSLLPESACYDPGSKVPVDWRQVALEAFNSCSPQEIEVECAGIVYSLDLTPIKDLGYINIYGKDVTERKRAEQMLRESEALLRIAQAVEAERKRLFDVLETLPPMICLLTPDYHIAFANRSFREKFGEPRGRHCYEYCFGHAEPCGFCESYSVLKTGRPHRWEFTGSDGSVIDACDFPFTDVDGSPMILAMEIDITDRRKAEAGLSAAMAKLEQSNQALQDFVSIASHDLQEPLRKVGSFGHMLKQKCGESLGEQGNDYLDRMLNANQRMQSLLQALLEYSRLATRADPFREVDLAKIVREVLSDLEVRIESSGAEVQVGDLPVIQADPTQMTQLFQNLIGNALKFRREGERPLIGVAGRRTDAGLFEIAVEDNGIGFEEQYAERIFAPFQRLHGKSGPYQGTGMGLAICRKIVERHGGSIIARSEPGKGSTFIIRLPAKQTRLESTSAGQL